MNNKWSYIVVVLFILGAGLFFMYRGQYPASSTTNEGLTHFVQGDLVSLDGVDVTVSESLPVEVNALLIGNFKESCESLGPYSESRDGNTILVEVYSSRPEDAQCAQVITPFQQTIPLTIRGLSAGTYTVNINGHQDSFVLDVDVEGSE